MNDKVATEDQENPPIGRSIKRAFLMGIPAVGPHQGRRTYAPQQQAGHMTAADQIVRKPKNCLPIEAVHICRIGAKSLARLETAARLARCEIAGFFGPIESEPPGRLASPAQRRNAKRK